MPRDPHDFLRRLEDRLSRLSKRLAERRILAERHLDQVHSDLESARRGREGSAARSVRDALARARATVEDMDRELSVPPAHAPLGRDELHALRRHLRLTATLLPHVSNLDDPSWAAAHDEYERSWDELERVSERGGSPSR